MDESEFRRLLQLGLGRAILYARDHDVRALRDLILDACLNCYAIDPQSEGTRADFMLDLVSTLPDSDFYQNGVLDALPQCGDDWHAKQRFRFASCMAQNGDERAKRLMYESFVPGPSKGEAIAIDFLNLDGMAGFLFAVGKIGELLLANPNGVDLGWLMSVATENLGEKEVWDSLRNEAARNPLVQAYLSAVEDSVAKIQRATNTNSIKSLTYEQLKTRLPIRMGIYLRIWGKQATDDDLLQAAHGLKTATDAEMQRSHLTIFWERRFPLDCGILFELASSSNERIQWAALKALAMIADPAVRSLAFDLVQTHAKWRELAIGLLSRNFQTGDHEIVLNWFETEEDLETLHSESRDLLAFWRVHPSEELYNRMLLDLYEKCPCSFCRRNIVSSLLERNALPRDLRAECEWDANFEIREMVSLK
ncbi:MAG: hypothetical protein ABSC48_16235 [Terracidiphilus sp.]|jgi:hypothetical protein